MSVLSEAAIREEMRLGRVRIEPFGEDQIGPASIDLHLGHQIRVPVADRAGAVHVTDDADPDADTKLLSLDDPYTLAPGVTVHGVTLERVSLPPDICAWIEGRSRIARLGLAVHVTSGFIHPGVQNHQVLELSNLAGFPLVLHPGVRICQIVLQRTEGEAIYRGRFAAQSAP